MDHGVSVGISGKMHAKTLSVCVCFVPFMFHILRTRGGPLVMLWAHQLGSHRKLLCRAEVKSGVRDQTHCCSSGVVYRIVLHALFINFYIHFLSIFNFVSSVFPSVSQPLSQAGFQYCLLVCFTTGYIYYRFENFRDASPLLFTRTLPRLTRNRRSLRGGWKAC